MLKPERPGGWRSVGTTAVSSNPFSQPVPSQSANPFATPLANPFAQSHTSSHGNAPNSNQNPFSALVSSAQKRSISPALGQQQLNSTSDVRNPFGKTKSAPVVDSRNVDSNPPKLNGLAPSQSKSNHPPQVNGTRKVAEYVQPAWPARQGKPSFTKDGSIAGKDQPSGKRKSETNQERRTKVLRRSPNPGSASVRPGTGVRPSRANGTRPSGQPFESPLGMLSGRAVDLAAKIQDQLLKDGITPPLWPANPGSDSQRPAVEGLREAHKAYRDRARKSLIRGGLIDDPDKKRSLNQALLFRGISEDMCPEWERITRITEKDVRAPEKEPDDEGRLVPIPDLMIKRLARSAAGQDAPLPMDVRSFATLRRTLDYMIDSLIPSDDFLPSRHSFLWDRTRAIRIDFSVQRYDMTPEEIKDLIYCLETIARFHVTSLHLLSREGFAADDFSEQQEIEQLGKTLISLKELYEDCARQGTECQNEAEFRGYYIVLNAHSPEIKETVQGWGTQLWNEDGIRTAMCLVESIENTWRLHGPLKPYAATDLALSVASMFFTIVESSQISYTMACFAEIHFNSVRKGILQIIRKSYSRPKGGPKDLTPSIMQRQLRFDTEEEAITFTEKHGFEWGDDGGSQYLIVNARQQFIDARIKHAFSEGIVERKRSGRSLPKVMRETVYEDSHPEHTPHSPQESLFVEDTRNSSFESSGLTTSNRDSDHVDETPPTSPPTNSSPFPPILKRPGEQLEPRTTDSIFSQPQHATQFQGASSVLPSAQSTLADGDTTSSNAWPSSSTSVARDKKMDQNRAFTSPSIGAPPSKKRVTFADDISSDAQPATNTKPSSSIFGFLSNEGKQADAPKAAGTSNFSNILSKPSEVSEGDEKNQSTVTKASSTPSPASLFPSSINTSTRRETFKTAAIPSPFFTSSSPDPSVLSQSSTLALGSTLLPPTFASASSSALEPVKDVNVLNIGTDLTIKRHRISQQSDPAVKNSRRESPSRDSMGDFARWFVVADQGLMEGQLEQFAVEHVLRDVWENFQADEEERLRKEEDEKSWAEARKFREYSLKVTYFYRWQGISRKQRVIKRIQTEKEKARQWKLPENVAKRDLVMKEAQEKAVEDAKMLMQRRTRENVEEASRLKESTVSKQESKEHNIAQALLASGVLQGVRDEKAAAHLAARDGEIEHEPDMLPAEKLLLRSKNQRRRKQGLPPLKRFPEPKTFKEGSKTAMLRAISGGTGRDSLSMSTGSLRNSTFSSSYRSSLGFNSSRIAKTRSKVTDPYWRLKASGLVQMPNGEYLHESLALPMLQEGHRFPGFGDYGLPREDSITRSESPPISVDLIRQSTSPIVDDARRGRINASPVLFEGSQKRKRDSMEEEEPSASKEIALMTRKRTRSGDGDVSLSSGTSEQDFLASIANLMQDVDSLSKSTRRD